MVNSLRAYLRGLVLLTFLITIIASQNSSVAADSCTVNLSYSVASVNVNSAIGLVVPVSTSCSFMASNLYAVGDAFDSTTHNDLGTTSALLANNGFNTYSGQLSFNLNPSASGHSIQVSVSVYGDAQLQYRSLLATSAETVTIGLANSYNPPTPGGCVYYGCEYNANSCQTAADDSGTTQCAGYLFQDPNGCVEIVVGVYSPLGLLSYQYYTLRNLPSSYPSIGSWVTVRGQLNQGYNTNSYGVACPGNYINVTSITQ